MIKKTQRFFSANVIRIKHSDLVDISKTKNYSSISKEIQAAYGPDGLGAIIIQDVPNHFETKHRLLSLTNKLTKLAPEVLKSLERPEINYGLGWSHGKEKFMGLPDTRKGSYYGCLHVHSELTGKSTKKTGDKNHWPREVLPELEPAFHDLGNQIRDVSWVLFKCIDNYIKSIFPTYPTDYTKIIENSDNNIGRLLHYFPRGNEKIAQGENWCGWHNDHGSLTGLVSSLYFNSNGTLVENLKLEKTGLWAQNRKGEFVKVTYGNNDIAYQIGETYQIQSGGRLHATPHAVIIDEDIPADVHRSTFALFMEPSYSEVLKLPDGSTIKDIKTDEIYKQLPKIEERFTHDSMTFEDFSLNCFKAYANN